MLRFLPRTASNLIAVTAIALITPAAASAATIAVTTTADTSPTACTLRDAITAANTNAAAGMCPEGTGLSDDIPITASGQIHLATPLPEITTFMAIDGPGASQLNVHRSSAPSTADFSVFSMAVAGIVSISDLTISNGSVLETSTAVVAGGAGVRNFSAELTLERVVVTDNWAEAIDTEIGDSAVADARGAGISISNGDLTLIDSTVSQNHTIATAVSDLNDGANSTVWGGGVFVEGTAVIEGSTIADNEATSTATSPGAPRADLRGGGVAAFDLAMEASTVSGNAAQATAPGADATSLLRGGGVSVLAFDSQIVGSTIVGNSIVHTTPSPGILATGGGVAAAGAPLTVTGSTISSNEGVGGANIVTPALGTTTLQDTIVSNPVNGDNCLTGGTAVSDGFNLEDPNPGANPPSCGFNQATDLTGIDPQLGPLQANGGPTLTRAPQAASPAIDKGSSFGLTTDQRGFARPVDFSGLANAAGGDGADIGAAEVQKTCSAEATPGAGCPSTVAPGPTGDRARALKKCKKKKSKKARKKCKKKAKLPV